MGPTPELLRRRLALIGAGNEAGTGPDFPLDVLVAQGLIGRDMRDEGMRYAMLAWWLYPRPSASCAALYDRMVAEGFGGGDFAPRPGGETDEEQHAHIRGQKARFARMLNALGGARSPLFQAVRGATQFLERPSFLQKLAPDDGAPVPLGAEDYRQMWVLTEGLRRLVAARGAEDRHWSRERAAAIAELSRP